MVEKGLGYTILTYAAVQDEVERKKLTAYPIVRPTLSTKVTIVTLRDKQLPKLTQQTPATCCTTSAGRTGAQQDLGRRATRLTARRRGRGTRRCHAEKVSPRELSMTATVI